MKKVKLKADYSFDFHIIGIISNVKEYTISWAINEVLHIELKKEADLEVEVANKEKLIVSNYVYESNFIRFSLIPNKILNSSNQSKRHFIPSLGSFDYLLKIEDLEQVNNIDNTFSKLRNAQKIDSVVKLDVKKIKEKESFLF